MDTGADIARQRLEAALNAKQRQTLEEHGYFELISNLGHVWRIYCKGSHMGNTYLRGCDFGPRGRSYCAQVYDRKAGLDCCDYPSSDHYLAQALWLAHDEAGFLRTAF